MKYTYWLSAIRGLSDRKKWRLQQYMKSASDVYYIEETELRRLTFLNEQDRNTMIQAKISWDVEKEYDGLIKKGIRIVSWFDRGYPARLKQIADSPYALYVKGRLPGEETGAAAVVGARRCTPYGEKYACEYGRALAEHGIEVISGLARGIDGMAQRGALTAGGRTFAVLGNGVDICYPKENRGLYEDIIEKGGGILSEFPPQTPSLPQNFPRRNRIISGLSDVVLVIEARRKSGSLITADFALEQGKDVYALPGPVDSPLSEGCNRLIYQGAAPLLSAEMLLAEMGISDGVGNPGKVEKGKQLKKMLETVDDMVYSSVRLYPKSASQMIEELQLPAQEVISRLASLEIQGYIKEISKNYYIRTQ